jgi:hypothetical protein
MRNKNIMHARIVYSTAAALASALIAAIPADAARKPVSAPLPTHNFVSLDMTSAGPPPLASNARRNEIDLLDSASATHTGDIVAFDVLIVRRDIVWTSPSPGVRAVANLSPPSTHTEHRTASCGWRSLGTTNIALGSTHQYSMQDQFLDADSPMLPIVDKLCAGTPLAAPRGAASEAAAADTWKDQFGPPPPALAVMRAHSPPRAATWMTGPAPHRFVRVDADTGNMSFLDRASIVRNGQTVTALSFALLAPQPGRTSFQMASVAVLREARYDCANKTMTVLAQATWNDAITLTGEDETPFAPWSAGESPVIARQIDAACQPGEDADTAASFDSVEAASAFAHQRWQDFNSPNTGVKVESH